MRTNHINVTKSANRLAAPTANDLGALTMYHNPRFLSKEVLPNI